jgi:hypothetical protein
MQRRLSVTLATVVAAGGVLLGAGISHAGSLTGRSVEAVHLTKSHHDDRGGCSDKFDKHQKAQKNRDFPSSHSGEAKRNATDQEARDADGEPYYTHDRVCDSEPSHGHWHDDSYKTFKRDRNHNTYDSTTGWSPKRYDYDHYGVSRCYHESVNSGHHKNCERNSGRAKKNDRKYNPSLNKVNHSKGN